MIEEQFRIIIRPWWENKPDSSDKVYCGDVRAELERILRTRLGKALAASLRFHGKTIYIRPYEGQNCNAEVSRASDSVSEAVMLFSPRLLRKSPCSKGVTGPNIANLPHEILFHELFHALRTVSNKNCPAKLTGILSDYNDSEEFLAILATNIFISDFSNSHKSGLRAGHEGRLPLEAEFIDSFQFFRKGRMALNIIAAFCNQNRGFAAALAQVHARHNPVGAYFRNQRKAFDLAVEGDADYLLERFSNTYRSPSGAYLRIKYGIPPSKPGP